MEDNIMKKIVFILITVLCMCCMVACGGEVKEDVSASSSNEVPDNSANDQPVVTEAPVVEPEVTPAPAEVTPEPTPDPYADLSGKEWVKTFKGVENEPKVVVFNDETGRKQIIEPEEVVLITHESDTLAVHLPEGYAMTGTRDLIVADWISGEGYEVLELDSEEMSKNKFRMSAVSISYKGEEFKIEFTVQTQE